MLDLAIKARIPIIRASTADLLNLPYVLRALAPDLKVVYAENGRLPTGGNLIYTLDDFPVIRDTYKSLADSNRMLLLVNHEPCPYAFDVGEIPVPRELVEDLLDNAFAKGKPKDLLPCFNGLTLKQMAEVIRITQARDKTVTKKGVVQTRALVAGKLQGLGQVDTAMPLYLCPPALSRWINRNRPYFVEPKDERLTPRGILLNGEPGVGKSAGAKYIAEQFGVPLYRLDLGASLGRWVGESEQNLSRILSTLDQEEPCVVLIDEAEKLFAETEDQGVTARLLSELLWWLAEHRSRVLTVMTTNNVEALPKELYRAGRIDEIVTIKPLGSSAAIDLAQTVLMQFIKKPTKEQLDLTRAEFIGESGIPHASVILTVTNLIKDHGWVD